MSAVRRNLPAVVEAAAPVKASLMRSTLAVPAVITGAGDHAARRFIEFFAATIRNKNTLSLMTANRSPRTASMTTSVASSASFCAILGRPPA